MRELIIVDDGSKDNTGEVAAAALVVAISDPDAGTTLKRRHVISIAACVALAPILKKHSGVWVGWSGKVVETGAVRTEIVERNNVTYVTADLAGADESPVYAILQLNRALEKLRLPEGYSMERLVARQPFSTERFAMKWDGEWHITYEVFRDLGLAFAAVLVLIGLTTMACNASTVAGSLVLKMLMGVQPAMTLPAVPHFTMFVRKYETTLIRSASSLIRLGMPSRRS